MIWFGGGFYKADETLEEADEQEEKSDIQKDFWCWGATPTGDIWGVLSEELYNRLKPDNNGKKKETSNQKFKISDFKISESDPLGERFACKALERGDAIYFTGETTKFTFENMDGEDAICTGMVENCFGVEKTTMIRIPGEKSIFWDNKLETWIVKLL